MDTIRRWLNRPIRRESRLDRRLRELRESGGQPPPTEDPGGRKTDDHGSSHSSGPTQ
jgi:hypothetical protein